MAAQERPIHVGLNPLQTAGTLVYTGEINVKHVIVTPIGSLCFLQMYDSITGVGLDDPLATISATDHSEDAHFDSTGGGLKFAVGIWVSYVDAGGATLAVADIYWS